MRAFSIAVTIVASSGLILESKRLQIFPDLSIRNLLKFDPIFPGKFRVRGLFGQKALKGVFILALY